MKTEIIEMASRSKKLKLSCIVLFFTLVALMSGCVNDALLSSATAYQTSTEPYLIDKAADLDKEGLLEEAYSLRVNMDQFKKTLDKYNTNKAWYEF